MSGGLLKKPTLGVCNREPWGFQEQAITAAGNEFRRGVRSTLIRLPTGSGKTTVFGFVTRRAIERARWRVLILAHTDELCFQAINELDDLGVEAQLEKAQSRARTLWDPDAVVACVPTLKLKRLQEWPRDYFNLIITDEAHHALADSYLRIYGWFSKAYHLGVTATPIRGDGESLKRVYQTECYSKTMIEMMTAPHPGPYLSRIQFLSQDIGIDLKGLRKKKGDFCPEQMAERITPHCGALANWWEERAGGRIGMIFTPDVGSAQGTATALQSRFLRWDWTSGDDPDREDKVKRYRAGDLDGIVNAELFQEGFNHRPISAIGIFKVTSKLGRLNQMMGRGSRLYPGKDNFLIMDPGLQAQLLGEAIGPMELMDAPWLDPATIELAAAELAASSGKPVDLLDAIERAQGEVKRREIVRVHAARRKIGGRALLYDPIAERATDERHESPRMATITPASTRQVEALGRFKIDGSRSSKESASVRLGHLIGRRKAGLASDGQVSALIGNGVPPDVARGMTFPEASAELDRLIGKQKRA